MIDPTWPDSPNQYCPECKAAIYAGKCLCLKARPGKPDDTQAAPIPNDAPATWDLVIADMGTWADPDLIALMRSRDALGLERYKTRLQPNNGRDSVRDALEEALDLIVYTKNAMVEAAGTAKAGDLMGVYISAREAVIRLHRVAKK